MSNGDGFFLLILVANKHNNNTLYVFMKEFVYFSSANIVLLCMIGQTI